jgi:hypothetical protein
MNLALIIKIGMTIATLIPTVVEFVKNAEEVFKGTSGAGDAKKAMVMEQVKAIVASMVDTVQEFTPDNIDLVLDKVEYTIGKFIDVAITWFFPDKE